MTWSGWAEDSGWAWLAVWFAGFAFSKLKAKLAERQKGCQPYQRTTGEFGMYQVKDAMSREVITVTPETTVEAAIHLFLERNISGAPVVDQNGRLRGIITQFQLLEVLYDPNVKNSKIEECMTRNVFTIEEDALLGTAANLLVVHRIQRIPVVRHGSVVGIISRRDLLRYFAETGEEIDAFFAKLKSAQNTEALAV
jgi:CBS domain-containing protein